MNTHQKNSGRCSCGSIEFETTASPICRAYCHCTICQNFNNSEYADVTAFLAKSVTSIDDRKIDYKVYKQPPMLKRGICRECRSPAIEKLNIPLMPKLILVPSTNIDNALLLPEPVMHIFYDKRTHDADDGLKKYSGFIPSQVGFSLGLMKGMILRK